MLPLLGLMAFSHVALADSTQPTVLSALVAEERGGVLTLEAESFYKQTATKKRAWHTTSAAVAPTSIEPDSDEAHLVGASGGAYVECLPDTRRTHADKLVKGESFSNQPGLVAILHYKVRFHLPGRYYVWARAYSTGSEDNGIHVGLNGRWPESGQRMQWCDGKNSWKWESKQRTEKEHCGKPYKIYLDIYEPGEHELLVSMREDGFELDKLMLTRNRDFRPE